jgi:hypothetical protein
MMRDGFVLAVPHNETPRFKMAIFLFFRLNSERLEKNIMSPKPS